MIKFDEVLESDKPSIKQHIKKKYRYTIPWIDKYRPKKLADVVSQHDVVKMLDNVLETGNLPHLLFYGQPGVGKTSLILAIAMELFGPKKFSERVIELNASDERGINVVRNKIVSLAKMSVSSRDPDYLCPDYKIIILDEADAMTTEAQSALRKPLEDNSEITRICFICNYINKIIDPIISRCVKVRFKPIDEENMFNRLHFIATNEKMEIEDNAIKTIANITNGDMRKGIMLLQNLSYLDKKIDVNNVLEIANRIPIQKIINVMDICIGKNKINSIKKLADEFIREGYPINTLLSQLIGYIVKNDKLDNKQKSLICYHIANTEKRLIDGGDEYLQLLSAFMCIKCIAAKEESVYKKMNSK
jgi:replication factor C subunit 2/4